MPVPNTYYRIAQRLPLALFLLVLLLAFTTAPAHAQTTIVDGTESFDFFGWAVATGDFDGNGVDDVATGVIGEDGQAGAVSVVYGSDDGLVTTNNQLWRQSQLVASSEPGDRFGEALAAGDFDGDGFDDLAIGTPAEAIGSVAEAGVVVIMYGSPGGITPSRARFFDESALGDNVESGDRIGFSLAAGNFDGDAYDDLAIGEPFEDLGSVADAGEVCVIYGTDSGLTVSRVQFWDQSQLNGTIEPGDRFGHAVTTGDFDGDGFDDLAVGAPFERIGTDVAGEAFVIYGTSSGLQSDDSASFWEDLINNNGSEDGDQFGHSLAAGDFDGDGFDDLAVGAPREDVGPVVDAGHVGVLYSQGASGLSATGSEFWNGSGPENLHGWAVTAGDFNGDGRDDLAISELWRPVGGSTRAGGMDIVYGTASGLTGANRMSFNQGQLGNSSVATDDEFGFALATGDLNDDGRDDLVIGTPVEDNGSATDSGAVNVVYGGPFGSLNLGFNQLLYQGAGIFAVADEDSPAAEATALRAPAPNPFRSATTLRFDLAEAANVRLTVYDLLGHRIAVLATGAHAAGAHEMTFDASGLAAGVYIARLESEGDVRTTRLTVVR